VSLRRRKFQNALHKSVSFVICSKCQRQLGPNEPVYVFRRACRPLARWCKTCAEQIGLYFGRHHCVGCGRELFATWGAWRNLICSPECQYQARLARRKIKREENRQRRVQTLAKWYTEAPQIQPRCWECGHPLPPNLTRHSRVYCSDACRQKAYRKRKHSLRR